MHPVEDPILKEVQDAGEAYFAELGFNMKAVCDDLRQRTQNARKSGREVVSHPPRPPQDMTINRKVG